MLFNSYQFLLFFPIVVLIYYVIPKKIRYIWLLAASYYFYMCWSVKYVFLILFSTVITFFSGIIIKKIRSSTGTDKQKQRGCKTVVGICLGLNLGILIFFKYFNWILENISLIVPQAESIALNILLPVGISFYTFQALSYTIDVYRGEIEAETNFFRYALFVSFFPQLVAGPIERSKNLLQQLDCNENFNYSNVKSGLLLMLWGFFEKIVIADKAAVFVDVVYNNYMEYEGAVIFMATVLFAFQIYCDFGGYSHIAIGAARVLNVNLMNNFKQPYYALGIKDFWSRWHISLSTWFRDYLYIPLGGNRCSKIRKHSNLFITFLVSGLWHGASWHYVVWGCLHGLYQIMADCTLKIRERLKQLTGIRTHCFSYRLFQRGVTFFAVTLFWLFFRANTMGDAIGMCQKMITQLNPTILLSDVIFSYGLNEFQWQCLLMAIIILLLVDWIHEKGWHIQAFIEKQNLVFRWGVYYGAILLIIISILQTFGQDAGAFIYFQF